MYSIDFLIFSFIGVIPPFQFGLSSPTNPLWKLPLFGFIRPLVPLFQDALPIILLECSGFFGDPKLIVLDEPNANLDEKGEQALVGAMVESTKNGNSVIVISHRPAILAFVDMIMVLQDGMIVAYGPKDEIMAKLSQTQKNPPVEGGN